MRTMPSIMDSSSSPDSSLANSTGSSTTLNFAEGPSLNRSNTTRVNAANSLSSPGTAANDGNMANGVVSGNSFVSSPSDGGGSVGITPTTEPERSISQTSDRDFQMVGTRNVLNVGNTATNGNTALCQVVGRKRQPTESAEGPEYPRRRATIAVRSFPFFSASSALSSDKVCLFFTVRNLSIKKVPLRRFSTEM
jgi:hypothetical protein